MTFTRDRRSGLYLRDGILSPPCPQLPRPFRRRYWKRIEDRPEWWKWQAAIAPVSGQHGTASALTPGTSVAKAFPGNITAHNAIIVTVFWATTGGVTCSVADNPGGGSTNTYTSRPAQSDATLGATFQDFVALDIKSGSDTVTATLSGTVAACSIFISEWSGVGLTGSAIDSGNRSDEAYATGTSTTPTSTAVLPSVAGCLIYGACDCLTSASGPATGWTQIDQDATFDITTIYKVQGAATSEGAAFSVSPSQYWEATALILAPPAAASSFDLLDLAHDPGWQPLITH